MTKFYKYVLFIGSLVFAIKVSATEIEKDQKQSVLIQVSDDLLGKEITHQDYLDWLKKNKDFLYFPSIYTGIISGTAKKKEVDRKYLYLCDCRSCVEGEKNNENDFIRVVGGLSENDSDAMEVENHAGKHFKSFVQKDTSTAQVPIELYRYVQAKGFKFFLEEAQKIAKDPTKSTFRFIGLLNEINRLAPYYAERGNQYILTITNCIPSIKFEFEKTSKRRQEFSAHNYMKSLMMLTCPEADYDYHKSSEFKEVQNFLSQVENLYNFRDKLDKKEVIDSNEFDRLSGLLEMDVTSFKVSCEVFREVKDVATIIVREMKRKNSQTLEQSTHFISTGTDRVLQSQFSLLENYLKRYLDNLYTYVSILNTEVEFYKKVESQWGMYASKNY